VLGVYVSESLFQTSITTLALQLYCGSTVIPYGRAHASRFQNTDVSWEDPAAILRVLFGPALPRLSGDLMLEGGVDLAAHPIGSRASIIPPMAGG
jgi:hypothetical protein